MFKPKPNFSSTWNVIYDIEKDEEFGGEPTLKIFWCICTNGSS